MGSGFAVGTIRPAPGYAFSTPAEPFSTGTGFWINSAGVPANSRTTPQTSTRQSTAPTNRPQFGPAIVLRMLPVIPVASSASKTLRAFTGAVAYRSSKLASSGAGSLPRTRASAVSYTHLRAHETDSY